METIMSKQFYDNVHGYIQLSELALKIIDTPPFQRLRYIHQLGVCSYVFPSATHTRFEHSVGTYHLAGRLLAGIRKNCSNLGQYLQHVPELQKYFQSHELQLDDRIVELVKIAALCHDLGHGPFSHAFDDCMVTDSHHEQRSVMILEMIVNKYNVPITKNELKFVQILIDPPKSRHGFIYQIVSNSMTGLDVDKYDYIKRDTYSVGLDYSCDFSLLVDKVLIIDNNICYPERIYYDIAQIFLTRYRLHKQVYQHKTVLAIQYMIRDLIALVDEELGISQSVNNMEKFCELTDQGILTMIRFGNNQKAKDLLDQIERRDLYKLECMKISEHPIELQDSDSDHIVHNTVLGTSNMLKNIRFFNKWKKDTSFTKNPNEVSFLLPPNFREYALYVFKR